ncbi:hypothetical protein [Bacillus mycoides]|uniref:hypothetical protein n=1 Tax=Bacillus mycoides TaxID=1405 RepID=UPI00027C1963|nr:hypothetical protein [Bacillus mycoides]EJV59351.1 hypothetical protein IEU_05616 [Bacillus mycoides]
MQIQLQISRSSYNNKRVTKKPTDYFELTSGDIENSEYFSDWFTNIEEEELGNFLVGLEKHEDCAILFVRENDIVEIIICDEPE